MAKFRKKPLEIEAIQWDGNNTEQVLDFTGHWAYLYGDQITITNFNSSAKANKGDWIVKDVNGEFKPVKDSVFKQTYEPIPEDKKVNNVYLHPKCVFMYCPNAEICKTLDTGCVHIKSSDSGKSS